jgi:hypothetical protein
VQEFTTSRFEMEDLFIHRRYKSNKLKVNLDKVSFKPKPFGINLILFVVDLTPDVNLQKEEARLHVLHSLSKVSEIIT